MPYIYHMAPRDVQGTILYPLNTLKSTHPDLFAKYVKKYEGRMQLMEQRIERLDCLWNDVLHCSPLNPSVVAEALRKLGKDVNFSYFEIDANKLEPENTAVYLYEPRERGTIIPQDQFVPYNPNEIEKYAFLPEGTVKYFKETLEEGGNPLLYHLVPHILYKGSIDTTGLKISTA